MILDDKLGWETTNLLITCICSNPLLMIGSFSFGSVEGDVNSREERITSYKPLPTWNNHVITTCDSGGGGAAVHEKTRIRNRRRSQESINLVAKVGRVLLMLTSGGWWGVKGEGLDLPTSKLTRWRRDKHLTEQYGLSFGVLYTFLFLKIENRFMFYTVNSIVTEMGSILNQKLDWLTIFIFILKVDKVTAHKSSINDALRCVIEI